MSTSGFQWDSRARADDGVWLRSALHSHTTSSDGEMSAEMLVRHFEWSEYDVLALTDHWVRTVQRSTRKLLVIPSTELNARVGTSGDDAHVLALGVEADPEPPDEFEPLDAVVEWIVANGGLPYLAHTYWSGLRTEQWVECEGLLGLEVWNTGCELEVGRGDASVHWDEALEFGRPLQGIATDDSHHPGYDSGFAWTMVHATERSQEAVLAALQAGRFYCSTGPVIQSIELDGDAVEVRCSPAQSVTLVSSRHRGARANAGRLGYPNGATVLARDAEGLITAVRLERPPLAPFGRVVVSDSRARRAWTNPLWTSA